MNGKPRIERKIDLSRMVRTFSGLLEQRVAVEVRNLAKKYVAHPSPQHPYSKGPLRDSIQVFAAGLSGVPYVFTDLPHSLAQERGRPDLPSYTFTPYMGPAAREATDNVKQFVDAAYKAAAILGAR